MSQESARQKSSVCHDASAGPPRADQRWLASRRSALACGDHDAPTRCLHALRIAFSPHCVEEFPSMQDHPLDKSHPGNCLTRRQNNLTASFRTWLQARLLHATSASGTLGGLEVLLNVPKIYGASALACRPIDPEMSSSAMGCCWS